MPPLTCVYTAVLNGSNSLGLASHNFYLITKLKEFLTGRKFTDDVDVMRT